MSRLDKILKEFVRLSRHTHINPDLGWFTVLHVKCDAKQFAPRRLNSIIARAGIATK